MGYKVFDDSSCTLTPDERRAEATRLCALLKGIETMRSGEQSFVKQISDPWAAVSIKQLFWLRDLNEKYNNF
jgi:hypothetical protein